MVVSPGFIFGLISLHLMMGCTGGNEMCTASFGHGWACPPTWYQWGGNCYKFINKRMTWSEAKEKCVQIGSVLVMPKSQEESDFLIQLHVMPKSTHFWINCNDLDREGTWVCLDGTDKVEFRNWVNDPGWIQPDNAGGKEHCANSQIQREGKWNDAPCDDQTPPICSQPVPQ